MKKLLFIFALLIASCDEKERCPTFQVTISDALPIQFWLSDCDTYNEKEVCGVHHKCWCHPWQCDDEIKIQLLDDPGELNEYSVKVFDSENTELLSFPLETYYSSLFLEGLSSAVNDTFNPDGPSHQPWTLGAIPKVTIASPFGASALILFRMYGAKANVDYNFDYDILRSFSVAGQVNMYVYDQDASIGSPPLGTLTLPTDVGNFNYTGVEGVPYWLAIEVVNGGSGSSHAEVNSIIWQEQTVDNFTAFHFGSFVPENEGICDEQISIKIYYSTSPETEVAKSDCIDVRTTQACTKGIDYSNNRNFAGLIYEADISPEQSFFIRVPAIFFHERFPEEDNAMELTSGIVKTSGVVKAQTLFETDYMPYYMHKKLKLIFKHQTITIDNQNWIKEEAYEIAEGDRRWPVKKAKCFLTESNFVQRAVL